MRIAAALVLACAVPISAAPILGPELRTDVIPGANNVLDRPVPALAIAADDDGFVIAWSQREQQYAASGRIHVARLDRGGHMLFSRVLPPATGAGNPDETNPVLARNGDGWIIAWSESEPGGTPSTAAIYRLDAELHERQLVLRTVRDTTLATATRASTTVVLSGGDTFQFGPDGTLLRELWQPTTDTTVADGNLVPIHWATQPYIAHPQGFCNWFGQTCPPQPARYQVFIGSDDARPVVDAPFYSGVAPAVATNGSEYLVAHSCGGETGYVCATHVDANFRKTTTGPLPQAEPSRIAFAATPRSASDGERYVVVWNALRDDRSDNDILGAIINSDGTEEALVIAGSPENESNATVVAVGPGSFFVVYEVTIGVERQLAGRFIDFLQPRRRAAP